MIIHLVTVGAGADSRRRTDILNSYEKLDDLHVTLWKEGYVLSIQDLYFCLIPRRADNQEGKRHARTVLVNLLKARNTLRNRDSDVDFTLAIKRQMRNVMALFGLIGFTAFTKDAPLIVHVSHKI